MADVQRRRRQTLGDNDFVAVRRQVLESDRLDHLELDFLRRILPQEALWREIEKAFGHPSDGEYGKGMEKRRLMGQQDDDREELHSEGEGPQSLQAVA